MTNLREATRYNGDGSSVPTILWLGYDAPTGAFDGATLTAGRAEPGVSFGITAPCLSVDDDYRLPEDDLRVDLLR